MPFANIWRTLEIGRLPGSLVLLNLIPIVGTVAVYVLLVIAVHRINRGFERGAVWTALFVPLPFVWLIVLGVGGSPWRGGDWRALPSRV